MAFGELISRSYQVRQKIIKIQRENVNCIWHLIVSSLESSKEIFWRFLIYLGSHMCYLIVGWVLLGNSLAFFQVFPFLNNLFHATGNIYSLISAWENPKLAEDISVPEVY